MISGIILGVALQRGGGGRSRRRPSVDDGSDDEFVAIDSSGTVAQLSSRYMYDIKEKAADQNKYNAFTLINRMNAKRFDMNFVRETGLQDPVIFTDGIEDLGMRYARRKLLQFAQACI